MNLGKHGRLTATAHCPQINHLQVYITDLLLLEDLRLFSYLDPFCFYRFLTFAIFTYFFNVTSSRLKQ